MNDSAQAINRAAIENQTQNNQAKIHRNYT